MFSDVSGGRNANRFGTSNNLYKERNDFSEYTNNTNTNNNKFDDNIGNNRMASAQI